ncbi:hypothetical protein ABK040_001394 [Willaertia magna]
MNYKTNDYMIDHNIIINNNNNKHTKAGIGIVGIGLNNNAIMMENYNEQQQAYLNNNNNNNSNNKNNKREGNNVVGSCSNSGTVEVIEQDDEQQRQMRKKFFNDSDLNNEMIQLLNQQQPLQSQQHQSLTINVNNINKEEEQDENEQQIALYMRHCHKLGIDPTFEFIFALNDKNVKSCNLSQRKKQLTDKDVTCIATALSTNKHITELDLSDSSLNGNSSLSLAEMFKKNVTLQTFLFKNNKLQDEYISIILKSISQNSNLIKLDLSGNLLGQNNYQFQKGIPLLIKANKIKYLILQNNYIDDDIVTIIVNELILNTSLIQLNLQNNKINDKGASLLGKLLHNNDTLQNLDISSNNIGIVGISSIISGLKYNKYLKKLNIRNNHIGDQGAFLFSKIILNNNCNLEELYLGFNDISINGGTALGHSLKSNKKLKIFDIQGILFNLEAMEYISLALKENHSLLKLYLDLDNDFNNYTTEIARIISEALKLNNTLQDLIIGGEMEFEECINPRKVKNIVKNNINGTINNNNINENRLVKNNNVLNSDNEMLSSTTVNNNRGMTIGNNNNQFVMKNEEIKGKNNNRMINRKGLFDDVLEDESNQSSNSLLETATTIPTTATTFINNNNNSNYGGTTISKTIQSIEFPNVIPATVNSTATNTKHYNNNNSNNSNNNNSKQQQQLYNSQQLQQQQMNNEMVIHNQLGMTATTMGLKENNNLQPFNNGNVNNNVTVEDRLNTMENNVKILQKETNEMINKLGNQMREEIDNLKSYSIKIVETSLQTYHSKLDLLINQQQQQVIQQQQSSQQQGNNTSQLIKTSQQQVNNNTIPLENNSKIDNSSNSLKKEEESSSQMIEQIKIELENKLENKLESIIENKLQNKLQNKFEHYFKEFENKFTSKYTDLDYKLNQNISSIHKTVDDKLEKQQKLISKMIEEQRWLEEEGIKLRVEHEAKVEGMIKQNRKEMDMFLFDTKEEILRELSFINSSHVNYNNSNNTTGIYSGNYGSNGNNYINNNLDVSVRLSNIERLMEELSLKLDTIENKKVLNNNNVNRDNNNNNSTTPLRQSLLTTTANRENYDDDVVMNYNNNNNRTYISPTTSTTTITNLSPQQPLDNSSDSNNINTFVQALISKSKEVIERNRSYSNSNNTSNNNSSSNSSNYSSKYHHGSSSPAERDNNN